MLELENNNHHVITLKLNLRAFNLFVESSSYNHLK